MANSSSSSSEEVLVPLPPPVERALQDYPSIKREARRVLSNLGEEASLQLIKNFGDLSHYINFIARVSESVPSQATSSSPNPYSTVPMSPQKQILGDIEFRKAFLVLSYCGRQKLEDVVTVDLIQRIKDLSMEEFESQLWNYLGCKWVDRKDRAKNLEWDSGRTHLYSCHFDPDGNYFFKGPYLQKQKTHLQRVLGDDKVLLVRFPDEVTERNNTAISSKPLFAKYQKIAKDGIMVGLRRYHFFVFKDGSNKKKKYLKDVGEMENKNPTSTSVTCLFVCIESDSLNDRNQQYILFNKPIHEARCVFMHVHMVSTLAKYMARFSLILSKTIKLEVDLSSVQIERIEDIFCQDKDGNIIYGDDGEALIHTDGTGFISEDLALKCPLNVRGGNCLVQQEFQRKLDRIENVGRSSGLTNADSRILESPLLIQSRLFYNGLAVKGTFLLNKKLPSRTIQIRPSMIKVDSDPKLSYLYFANSFEVVSTSNKPKKKAPLSKLLIPLLNYGGVSKDYFLNLLTDALEVTQKVHSNKRAAITVSVRHGYMDDFLVARMILSGVPLDEPYLHSRLSILMRDERKGLKQGRIPMDESYYLMGTTDPTGLLNHDEVCVILDDGQISGKVLVYRHPGLHFGDIHVLNAIYVEELERFVGNAKYAIFFPTKGPRSLADEMANGDFDGDMYWVSKNPQLLESYKPPSKPWPRTYTNTPHQRKPIDCSNEELENELWQQFLTARFDPCYVLGSAADNWLAFMDRFLTLGDGVKDKDCLKKNILRLVDIYYDALDASKTGKKVDIPWELKAKTFPHFLEKRNFLSYPSKSVLGLIYDTVDLKMEDKSKEIWQLPCFSGEVPAACMKLWKGHYEVYRGEMQQVMERDDEFKNESADEIILKYKQILYGGKEFEESTRKIEDIYNEAQAIYQITYDYAKEKGVNKCGFAWKVAGRALCILYATNQDDNEVILCLKSVLQEVLN